MDHPPRTPQSVSARCGSGAHGHARRPRGAPSPDSTLSLPDLASLSLSNRPSQRRPEQPERFFLIDTPTGISLVPVGDNNFGGQAAMVTLHPVDEGIGSRHNHRPPPRNSNLRGIASPLRLPASPRTPRTPAPATTAGPPARPPSPFPLVTRSGTRSAQVRKQTRFPSTPRPPVVTNLPQTQPAPELGVRVPPTPSRLPPVPFSSEHEDILDVFRVLPLTPPPTQPVPLAHSPAPPSVDNIDFPGDEVYDGLDEDAASVAWSVTSFGVLDEVTTEDEQSDYDNAENLPIRRQRPNEFIEDSKIGIRTWYVVTKGYKIGVFSDWIEAHVQINGCPGSSHHKKRTWADARDSYLAAKNRGDTEIIAH
ncbi:hypothetical protein BXZ70DRAFT_1013366 [Cristinia sonorae]|uniref:Ribonuclease H1 N-terminal domain-containing protein n=1 Tax=Cristinia sonorae TaxID=1940300 RepID=A0A8K0UC68_9AGAR|nr:hypothetical protein BXZ70DRAFT_1013366 [Cristinia sonorae]